MNSTLTNRQRSLLCYYKRSRRYMRDGLTSRGMPRKRELLTPDEDKRRRLARWHERSSARTEQGLTTRGTARKRRDLRRVQREYRGFRNGALSPQNNS